MFEVPTGFKTDFASVPRLLFWLFPAWGRYGEAAVLHDWLCAKRQLPSNEAHRLFREAMEALCVTQWKRWTMWAAVRAFGPRW